MWEEFTSKYSLSKTLRFELKPVGEMAERIEDFKSQYLKDEVVKSGQRAKDYQAIKKLIDDYHREYIEGCLAEPVDKKTGEILDFSTALEEAFSYYERLKENPAEHRKAWETEQNGLRKTLVTSFVDNDGLFKKEFITHDLPEWLQKKGLWDEHKDTVESFKKFTTYFTGFHENRKNMYTAEAQSTAIANRLMNENLPRFFNNCMAYYEIREKYPDLMFQVDDELLKIMKVEKLDDIFQPRYFINLFAQSGTTLFNNLLGGKTTESGEKIQGLNEQINLYRQQHPDVARGFPRFTKLHKQILSDRESHSYIPEAFEDDKQLLEALKVYISEASEKLLPELEKSVEKLSQADLGRVYIKGASLASLSQEMFHFFGAVPDAIRWYAESNMSTKKERERFTKQDVYVLADVDSLVSGYICQLDADDEMHQLLEALPDSTRPVSSFLQGQFNEGLAALAQYIKQVKPLLGLEELSKNRRLPRDDNDKGGKGFQQMEAIREMLDAFKAVSDAVKSLHLVKGRKPIDMPDVDTGFYAAFAEAYEEFSQPTISLYNKTRNHLTKKPFSKDKVKVNFDKGNLLDGFVESKTDNSYNGTQYGGYLFRKKRGDGEYNYFLGISKKNNLFSFYQPSSEDGEYERLHYYQMKTTSVYGSSYPENYDEDKKDFLDKLITAAKKHPELEELVSSFLKKDEKMQTPTSLLSMIKDKYEGIYFQIIQSKEVSVAHQKNINNIKKSLKSYEGKVQGVQTLLDGKHDDLKTLQEDIDKLAQTKSFVYRNTSQQEFDAALEEGHLSLFQIYNKDFSEKKKKNPDAKDNLHTMFFKALMSGDQDVFDIGKGEVFFRRHSLEYDKETRKKGHHYDKLKGKFDYPIIKDRRYSVDKFMLHLSVSLNYKSPKPNKGAANQVNVAINSHLKKVVQQDIHVIGIDRGERHLLYYTVVNSNGDIVDQGSLNKINTGLKTVDYQQKLDEKEKERDKARKTWSTIENIKELKAGYLSQVVHKLAQLIIKHNAVVCLEDLNFGFKRGRFKVEKQVYQKFEKALIDKLNYLVFKEHSATEPGGYMNAYQLAAPFVSFEKLGKQTGILYYVRADYTSKIDPATGFVDFLKPKYESLLKSKTFFESFDGIFFNADKGYFEFAFDYKKLTLGRKLGNYQMKWTVCTFGDTRYQNRKNKSSGKWETEAVNVTAELKALFEVNDIAFEHGADVKSAIAAVKDTKFYKKLYWLLRLTLSLRHSVTGTDEDFILSPVANEKGGFFDSRKASDTMPKDADANGAYHIALKGLWNLQQIRQHDWAEEKPKKLNLAMKNEEWFAFAQKKLFRS